MLNLREKFKRLHFEVARRERFLNFFFGYRSSVGRKEKKEKFYYYDNILLTSFYLTLSSSIKIFLFINFKHETV